MSTATFQSMPVSQLRPHPRNIRDEVGDVSELAASIKAQGLLSPIVIAPHEDLHGDYVVIAGHRRLAAARKADLTEVPVVVRHDLDSDDKIIAAMLVENLQRSDLSVLEEAAGYQALLDFGDWTAQKISKQTGVPQNRVSSRAALTKLEPDERQGVLEGTIPVTNAAKLAELAGTDKYDELKANAKYDTAWFGHRFSEAKEELEWEQIERPRLLELEAKGQKVLTFEGSYGQLRNMLELSQVSEVDQLKDVASKKALEAVARDWPEAVLLVHGPSLAEASKSDVYWYLQPEVVEEPLTGTDGEEEQEVDSDPFYEYLQRLSQFKLNRLKKVGSMIGDQLANLAVADNLPESLEAALKLKAEYFLGHWKWDDLVQDKEASDEGEDPSGPYAHSWWAHGLLSNEFFERLTTETTEVVQLLLILESLVDSDLWYAKTWDLDFWIAAESAMYPATTVNNIRKGWETRRLILGIEPQKIELELLAKYQEILGIDGDSDE